MLVSQCSPKLVNTYNDDIINVRATTLFPLRVQVIREIKRISVNKMCFVISSLIFVSGNCFVSSYFIKCFRVQTNTYLAKMRSSGAWTSEDDIISL